MELSEYCLRGYLNGYPVRCCPWSLNCTVIILTLSLHGQRIASSVRKGEATVMSKLESYQREYTECLS